MKHWLKATSPRRSNSRVYVATLTLLDSSLKGFAPDAAQLGIKHAVQRAFDAGGLEAARVAWLAAPLLAAARENSLVTAQLEAWVADYCGWHWAHGVSPSAQIPDLSQRLTEIAAPTLIAVGALDTAYFHGVAHAMPACIEAQARGDRWRGSPG